MTSAVRVRIPPAHLPMKSVDSIHTVNQFGFADTRGKIRNRNRIVTLQFRQSLQNANN
jgi:hypothetical protein